MGMGVDYVKLQLLTLGFAFPLESSPFPLLLPYHRNPTSFLNKVVAKSPSGDFLCNQPQRITLLFYEAAVDFLIES